MNRLDIAKRAEQEAFLNVFREILRSYGEEKEIYSVPQAMKFLRESIRKGPSSLNGALARAVFTGVKLFPLLQQAVSFLPSPEKTEDLFGSARRAAVAFGAHDTSYSLWYALCHPRSVWSSFSGFWLGHRLFGKWFPFDPKGFAKNISGLLFEESIGDGFTLDWTMGPTPTVGDTVAPELERAIEGLKDRERWVYINLQSLGTRSERPRSLSLLDASKRHPGKFCAASLSVDSPLYLGKEGGDIVEHKKMLLMQLSRAIFLNETTWYFFSLESKEKEKWWSVTEEVVERAFSLAQGNRVVFHELVVLGLIRAWQAFHGHDIDKLISTIACKECIDRGGSVNTAFLWALLGHDVEEKERALRVMAVLWGRPLLAKKRLIEKSRTKGFQALVKQLSPVVVREYLDGVWAISASHAAAFTASSRLVL